MNDLILRAQNFAHSAHDSVGQKRKYTGKPYWVHTDRVAALVATVNNDPEVVAAAHLHDVVEDVNKYGYDIVSIALQFGARVAKMVTELTHIYTREKFPHFNRSQRKDLEAINLGVISADSQDIKLCDFIDNTADIVPYDKGFARVYLAEKEKALFYLTKGNKILWERAKNQLTEALKIVSV